MKKYFILFLLIFFVAVSANAKNYFVRQDGNNNCNGLYDTAGSSGNCAWSTLQYAADKVIAGDIVNIGDGTYAGFMIQTAGTKEMPVTFKAQSTGANITTRNSKTNDGINIESWGNNSADYITLDGLNVSGIGRMGIRAIGGKGIIIQNCTVHNCISNGIFSGNTPFIKVLNNITFSNGSSGQEHNIYISNYLSDNCVIKGNTVYSSGGGNGIQINGDYTSGGDGYIDYPIVEDNIVYSNYQKGLSMISIRYGTIQNNVIYNNGSSAGGIHLVEQGATYYSIGNTVTNNTIHQTAAVCIRVNSGNTGNVIFNNICIYNGNGIVFEGSGNFESNNYEATAAGSLFINAGSRDYHLASGSAAIGYGVTTYNSKSAPSVDKEGNNRTVSYDAGAYEYGATTPPLELPGAPYLKIVE